MFANKSNDLNDFDDNNIFNIIKSNAIQKGFNKH